MSAEPGSLKPIAEVCLRINYLIIVMVDWLYAALF